MYIPHEVIEVLPALTLVFGLFGFLGLIGLIYELAIRIQKFRHNRKYAAQRKLIIGR